MLQFFERHDNVPAKVRVNPRHARLAEPLSSGARSWRTDMRPADLERFEAVAGDLLTELGYERGAPGRGQGAGGGGVGPGALVGAPAVRPPARRPAARRGRRGVRP